MKLEDLQAPEKLDSLNQQIRVSGYQLQKHDDILQLVQLDHAFNPLVIDFTSGKSRHRRIFGGGKNQPLARAVGIKGQYFPDILDITAGLGRDAFVLATFGCQVRLLERSEVVVALLANALQRAGQDAEIMPIIQRMQLLQTDSMDYLRELPEVQYPSVIYMDPMYPHREKSALVKKEMRIIRDLLGDDMDSDDLLLTARKRARKRIVVKRPKGAAYLADIKPHSQVASKNTRYDLYLPA